MANSKLVWLAGLLIFFFIWIAGYSIWAAMCIPIFVIALLLFIRNLSIAIPFRELAIVVSSLQLLVSSFMAFYLQEPDPIFRPKGAPESYFEFAVPGVLLFGLGLFIFRPHPLPDHRFLAQLQTYDLQAIGKKLIAYGWGTFILQPFVPSAISYFMTLVVFLSYIGGMMILFSPMLRSQKWVWIGFAYLPVVRDALFSGIFFLAMIWIAYLAIYFLFRARKSFAVNLCIILFGIYLVVVTDTAKKDFRSIIGEKGANIGFVDKGLLFGTLFLDNASFQILSKTTNVSARVTRANQGALVTWVMAHTPKIQPYGEGETIKDAIIAAIFPRFLMPDKAQAGGKENFVKYTGHILNKSTSMNISLLGEGWANFGYWGGLFFMFGVGVFYSYVYRIFSETMQQFPLYFFFIPFVFIYTIKAEDDLLTPLNHIFKALMVMFALHQLVIKKIKPVRG